MQQPFFLIQGRTVTHDIERAIQDQLFSTPLQMYLCQRWTSDAFNSIDWESYFSVYSQYPRSRKFFYQFGWKKLLTGKRLHSRESRYDDRCPNCCCPDETDDHVFQCNSDDCIRWRAALTQCINDTLTPFFNPDLLDMVNLGFIFC